MKTPVFQRVRLLWSAVAICALLFTPLVHSAERAAKLSRVEAEELVRIWLASKGYDPSSKDFFVDSDPDQKDAPDFYYVSAYQVAEQSVPTLGHFAINRFSADVWDWVGCKKLSSPRLRAKQQHLRQQHGIVFASHSSSARPCTLETE